MSELKRLRLQLEQLEKTHKLGIISKEEYEKGKKNIQSVLGPLEAKEKKNAASKKIVNEIIAETKEPKIKPLKKVDSPKKKPKKEESKKPEPKKQKAQEKVVTKSDSKKKPKGIQKKEMIDAQEKKAKSDTKKRQKKSKKESQKKEDSKEVFYSRTSTWLSIIVIIGIILILALIRGPDTTYVFSEKNLTNVSKTVKIVSYTSYSCEVCDDFDTLLKDIKMVYGDNVDIRKKHYPYDVEIDFYLDMASDCAESEGAESFEKYSRYLYDVQKPVSKEQLFQKANEFSFNMTEFEGCYGSNETRVNVIRDYLVVKSKDIVGTPAVTIDFAQIIGLKDPYVYELIIDKSLGIYEKKE